MAGGNKKSKTDKNIHTADGRPDNEETKKDASLHKEVSEKLETNLWRTELEEKDVNEYHWRCSVTMLVEETAKSSDMLEKYRSAAKEGTRPVIRNIDMADIVDMLSNKQAYNRSRGNKAKESKKSHRSTSEFDQDTKFLIDAAVSARSNSVDGSLPTDFLSLIIKSIILKLKNEDILRRELIQQIKDEAVASQGNYNDEESEVNKKLEDDKGGKNKGSKGGETQTISKSKSEMAAEKTEKGKKSKGKDKEERRTGKKQKSPEPAMVIEDQPIDGPQLYITLTSFYEALLPMELEHIKVPINSIVKISKKQMDSQETVSSYSPEEYVNNLEISTDRSGKSSTKTVTSQHRSGKKSNKKIDVVNNIPDEASISQFWIDMRDNLKRQGIPTLINNVAFLTLPSQEDEDLVHEKVYDLVCKVLFDTYDLTWLHDRYLSSMTIHEIPRERLGTEVFDEFMGKSPEGCMTVGYFLNAILEQVCNTVSMIMENGNLYDGSTGSSISEDETNQNTPKEKQPLDPHKEEKAFFNMFISDANLPEATMDMLEYGVAPSLFKLYRPKDEIANNSHLWKVWEHTDPQIVTRESICTFLKMLRLNTIECKGVQKYRANECFKYESVIVNDLYDMTKYILKTPSKQPHSHFKKRVNKLCYPEALIKLYLNRDIVCFMNLLYMIIEDDKLSENRYFYEKHSPGVILQYLTEAYNTFNCMDHMYIDVVDSVLLRFHNQHDKRGILKENWMEMLTTPVGFRDFCSFTMAEHKEWVKLEQENLMKQREQKLKDIDKSKSGLLNSKEVAEHNESFNKDIGRKHHGNRNSLTGKEHRRGKNDSEESSQEFPTVKNVKQAYCKKKLKPMPKPFEGYNVDTLRIQISGSKTMLYSTTESHVKVEMSEWLYGGEKLLGIEILKSGHALFLNKSFHNSGAESCVSFHTIFASNIILTFQKRITDIPVVLSPKPSQRREIMAINDQQKQETNHKYKPSSQKSFETVQGNKPVREDGKTGTMSTKEGKKTKMDQGDKAFNKGQGDFETGINSENMTEQTSPTCNQYNVKLSWPNGLFLETVPGIAGGYPIYVKQQYICQAPKEVTFEKFRCILNNGHVIVFENNGNIKIMTPNGTIFTCKEYKYHQFFLPSPSPPPPPPSPEDSENAASDKKASHSKGVTKDRKTGTKSTKEGEKTKQSKKLDDTDVVEQRRRSVRWSIADDSQENGMETPVSEKSSSSQLSDELEDPFHSYTVLQILDYDVLTPMGEYYTVKDDAISQVHEYIPLCIDTVENTGEVYIIRMDGTKTFYKSNGHLLVIFPDGTRISTRMIVNEEHEKENNDKNRGRGKGEAKVEDEELEIVWNDKKKVGGDDKHGFIGSNYYPQQDSSDYLIKMLGLSNTTSQEEVRIDQTQRNNVLSSENVDVKFNFESIHLGCLIEHPNYASISFDNKSKLTIIAMPSSTHMMVYIDHLEDKVKVELDGGVCLEQNQGLVTFSKGSVYETCINLEGASGNVAPLCTVKDERGDMLIIHSSGETNHIPFKECGKKSPCRSQDRYFALSRDLSGSEFIPRKEFGTFLYDILERGGRVEIKSPSSDPLIYIHKVCKPIWDNPVKNWTVKYVQQPEHPKNISISNLTSVQYNPYLWLQYHNRTRKSFQCENQPPQDDVEKEILAVDQPWHIMGRLFFDITKDFAVAMKEGLTKYCDKGVALIDQFIVYKKKLKPWQDEILQEALVTDKIPVMKVFAHFDHHVGKKALNSLNDIIEKYDEITRRAEQ